MPSAVLWKEFRLRMLLRTSALSTIAVLTLSLALPAGAAQLSQDASAAIPENVQQLIVVDYRAMENSPAAMDLKAHILPPELKSLESALASSGLDENHDVDELAFAAFKVGDETEIVGLAQGQFSLDDMLASFKHRNIKPKMLRDNKIYPLGNSGMEVVFLNSTSMVFGQGTALKSALDARDGLGPSLLDNSTMIDQMHSVDSEAVWSILDQEGTQAMMRGILGEASQLADFDTVKKQLLGSRYSMDFEHGVKFNLNVVTPDTVAAATMASLLNAAALYKKMSGSSAEKTAIDNTTINSSGGILEVSFSSSDDQFSTLLRSDLFQSVVK